MSVRENNHGLSAENSALEGGPDCRAKECWHHGSYQWGRRQGSSSVAFKVVDMPMPQIQLLQCRLCSELSPVLFPHQNSPALCSSFLRILATWKLGNIKYWLYANGCYVAIWGTGQDTEMNLPLYNLFLCEVIFYSGSQNWKVTWIIFKLCPQFLTLKINPKCSPL